MRNEQTGSTAISMTYGEYLKEYPTGRKDDDAKDADSGYCIIDNEDKNNICWLSERAFNQINRCFGAIAKLESSPKWTLRKQFRRQTT